MLTKRIIYFALTMLRQLVLLLLIIPGYATSQALIELKVIPNNTSIRYFKPFDKFGNFFIPSTLTPDENGEIHISVDIEKPTFVNLVIGNDGLWLLLEPKDKIRIEKESQYTEKFDGLSVTGNNSTGHIYYNTVFNKYPIDKALGIQSIFEDDKINTNTLFERLSVEINKQLKWVDSLHSLNHITEQYARYMRTEIQGLLAWEIGNLCDKRFLHQSIQTNL